MSMFEKKGHKAFEIYEPETGIPTRGAPKFDREPHYMNENEAFEHSSKSLKERVRSSYGFREHHVPVHPHHRHVPSGKMK